LTQIISARTYSSAAIFLTATKILWSIIMDRVDGKVVIITGGANGIGRGALRLFAQEGAKIIVADIDLSHLHDEVRALNAAGAEVLAIRHDVSNEESWIITVQKTLQKFSRIDVLINNAGIVSSNGVLETEIHDWTHVMDVNLKGVWLGMKQVIPHMQRNGGGSIINTSSVAALSANTLDGIAYSASKGGVRSMTKYTAKYLAKDNIRVNSVYPGPIYTEMTARAGIPSRDILGQIFKDFVPLPPHAGTDQDIAQAYLYLASDESKFVTGAELVVDGGWTSVSAHPNLSLTVGA